MKTQNVHIRIFTMFIVISLIFIAFAGCTRNSNVDGANFKPNGNIDGLAGKMDNDDSEQFKLMFASSYDDIKDKIEKYWTASSITRLEDYKYELYVNESAVDTMDSSVQLDTVNSNIDYSTTNVQVKGIDEEDIVKTDGEYIYIVRNNELGIVKAEGANTYVISTTAVVEDRLYTENSGGYCYPVGMYVCEDRLAVVVSAASWSKEDGVYSDSSHTYLQVFDISDRSDPKLINKIGQDGYYNASRMINGTVYLISDYHIYNYRGETLNVTKPEDFVPRLYANGNAFVTEPKDICILPYIDVASSYTVISSIDMEKAELLSSKSLLGVGGTVYMNSKNLYIATARYEYEQSDEYQQEQYTVVEHKNSNFTDIVRIELSADINVSANGSVSGQLLNQFSMDEYNDYLRVVTTVDNSSYKIFSDDKHGLAKYEWDEEVLSNSLYVLDDQLQIVGAIEEMGEDERVYSVRFDGDIGYFVTFRQTDPLFAVELSDPSNPKVLSALKISGFSEYLHVYGDNKLFGLGMEADEETGITQCMKLSMFDISDPADVTECAKILIEDCYWSEALYNHKTILISEEKNMIAFPVEGRYVVYGYSDEMGFYIRASFDVDEMDIYNVRGLYIGDYIYICSTELIEVFDMSEFINIAQIAF